MPQPQTAKWWHPVSDNRIACDLCPQACSLSEGALGICGARFTKDGKLLTNAWGVGTHPAADPVEKKPLNHFLPGSGVISFGLVGCNLSCAFCQNWGLSTSRSYKALQPITAEGCVKMAIEQRCASIAFTYNEPTISAEFCLEVANVAHQAGIKTIAVTNGYIHGEARSEFFEVMDAANVDIKSINPDFYAKHCGARLEPVLETLTHLARSRRTWLEITNLLIPSLNDSDSDIEALVDWVGTHLGADVPLHFSAFHPAHRTQSLPITPYETLGRAKDRAIARGIRYVYLGNTPQPQITNCPKCKRELIRRTNYVVAKCDVLDGKCPECGAEVAGCF